MVKEGEEGEEVTVVDIEVGVEEEVVVEAVVEAVVVGMEGEGIEIAADFEGDAAVIEAVVEAIVGVEAVEEAVLEAENLEGWSINCFFAVRRC